MRTTHKKLIIALLAASCIGRAAASDWYQIEMIVFAHSDSASESEESWPEDVALSYPSRLKILFDPISLPSDIDTSINTTLEVDVPNLMELPAIELPSDTAALQFEENTTSETNDIPSASQDEPVLSPQPLAFQRLDDNYKQLSAAYQHLRRIDRYRPLFHEVWQQPLESRRQSPSVLITGGEQFGAHHELEGSIKIAVERYLHIDTDLWLHSFLPNFGQQSTYRVPELPTAGFEDNVDSNFSPFSLIVDEPYSVSRTVTLRQSRRMRSGEIHYLDHPLMGIIVLVTPLQR
jgi:hypothetical protein